MASSRNIALVNGPAGLVSGCLFAFEGSKTVNSLESIVSVLISDIASQGRRRVGTTGWRYFWGATACARTADETGP